MERYCNNSWTQIVQLLRSNIETGLSEKDCAIIKRKKGMNKIDLPDKVRIHKHILNALKSVNVIIYIGIISILFVFSQYIYGAIVVLFLLSNIIISTIHSCNRNKDVSSLEKVLDGEIVVIRDSMEQLITCENLVPGDIVRLATGNIVPADIRIIRSNDLMADETVLMGEKSIKKKNEDIILADDLQMNEMNNILFKGSRIIGGDGLGIVIETGNLTVIGKLLAMFKASNMRKHSFKLEISKVFDKYFVSIFFMIIAISAGMFFADIDNEYVFLTKAVFALGCLPMAFICMCGYRLILKRFYEAGIKIFNFSVFNLINEIDIMFLDKIGAISAEEMSVNKLYVNDSIISKDEVYKKEMTIDRLLEISIICNNSKYDIAKDEGEGDMAEVAFLSYGARKKITKATVDANNSKLFEMPIDPDKKCTTVITKVKGRFRANTKGNIDSILENCTHIMQEGIEKELTDDIRNKIKLMDMNFSTEGLITQGFAYRNFNYLPSKSENVESNMVFVGIIALENPLKHDVRNDIRDIKDRGIVPILFTDESKLSAITNCLKCDIIRNKNQVVAGIELDSLNPEELKELVGRVRVFCRASSETKAKIIALFVKDGYNVATVGDNLNDLQILNLSKLGVSRGNAPSMVQKLSDVFVKENYLDKIFDIKRYSDELKVNINRGFKLFLNALFIEIAIIIGTIVFNQSAAINFWNILIVNSIVLIPLELITVLKNGKESSFLNMLFRTAVICAVTLVSMYKVEIPEAQIIPFVYIPIDLMFLTLCNSGISLKKISNELFLSILTLFIIVISVACIIVFNNIVVRDVIMAEILVAVFIFLVYEILVKKWQNS